VGSSARAYPNYMAYANELWGGPAKTHEYLTDSNTDWAQQLLAVKQYTDERGIKDCWFAYFADPFLLPKDYGIPCKPLPTPDSWFVDVQHPVPATIQGPVLISAGTLTGFELGSSVLNPYREFEKLPPDARIQDGVFVYEGTFHVPLASALSYVQQSAALLKEKRFDDALSAAEQGVAIEPDAVQTQMALGDAFVALGRTDEARAAYSKAMDVVRTMEPGAQEVWVPKAEKKLAGL
jgi:tetratricopeptide (TPR) repeat protein